MASTVGDMTVKLRLDADEFYETLEDITRRLEELEKRFAALGSAEGKSKGTDG